MLAEMVASKSLNENVQIAKTVQTWKPSKNPKIDEPVLGLAGCDVGKLQVHGGGQLPLPPLWNSFVGTGIHNGPVPPAS